MSHLITAEHDYWAMWYTEYGKSNGFTKVKVCNVAELKLNFALQ